MTLATSIIAFSAPREGRRVRSTFALLAAFLLAAALTACGGNGATTSGSTTGTGASGTGTSGSGGTGGTGAGGTTSALTSLQVTPASPTTFIGSTVRFRVRATYANGSTQDVTSSATWNSSNTGVATVSNAASSNGVATTLAAGTTNITASLSGVTSANASLTVNAVAESVLYSFGSGGAGDGANPYGALIQASDGNLYGMTTLGGASGNGTLLKVAPSGTVTVIHTFNGGIADGSQPYGSLIQASDGNLYGMTYQGGASNKGTVFQVNPTNGTVTVIYSFGTNGPNDGANPDGSFIQTSDGKLYGTTVYGGTSNNGTVFSITLAGAEQVIYSFGALGSNDGANPYGSLVQASDGNFYAMTFSGGSNGTGAVVQVTPGGTEQVIHSFGGPLSNDGANPYGSLVQASDGNLYGMTNKGGANHAGAVIQVTLAGAVQVIHSFGGSGDGAGPGGSFIQANDGNLYGLTTAGGANGNGVVFQLTLGGAEQVLYSFGANGSGDGAYANSGLVQGSDGNLYGMTVHGGAGAAGNGTVFKLY